MIKVEDIMRLEEKYKDDAELVDALNLLATCYPEHLELKDLKSELGSISASLEQLENARIINPLRDTLKKHGLYLGGM